MTPTPNETEDAERAEFWRLTQEALAKHPDALDEDPVWGGRAQGRARRRLTGLRPRRTV
jgi:hypothetical protein